MDVVNVLENVYFKQFMKSFAPKAKWILLILLVATTYPATSAADPIEGCWDWFNGNKAYFYPNGEIYTNNPADPTDMAAGTWKINGNVYEITWLSNVAERHSIINNELWGYTSSESGKGSADSPERFATKSEDSFEIEGIAGELKKGRIDLAVQMAPLPFIKAMGAKFSYTDPTSGLPVTLRRKQNMPMNYDGTPQYLFDFHEVMPADVKEVKVELYWYDGNKWLLVNDSKWGSIFTYRVAG